MKNPYQKIKNLHNTKKGDHIALLYESDNEFIATIISFIKDSLSRGEKCLYIKDHNHNENLMNKLNENITDLKRYIEKGQLQILSKEKTYIINNNFDSDQMIELIKKESNKALAEGYSGLSITGELSEVIKFKGGKKEIINYEWKLNQRIFENYPVVALCRYDINKFDNEIIKAVIELHPYLIWEGELHENPYYVSFEGYKTNKVRKYEIKSWLENIKKYKKKESEFKEELEIMNEELERSIDEMNKLNQRFIDMIDLVANIEDKTLLNEKDFFSELLNRAIEIVPEADYGKVCIVDDDGNCNILYAYGHNIKLLKNLKIEKEKLINSKKKNVYETEDYFVNFKKLSQSKRKVLKEALNPIKESLTINIYSENKFVGKLVLDIKKGSNKEFSDISKKILRSFANLASSFFAFKRFDKLRTNFTKELLTSIINILEMYDIYTKGHSENVANLAVEIAKEMNLPEKLIKDTYWSGLVHDIGKLLIPLNVLNKDGKLSDKEYELIKKHPVYGKKALSESESLEHIAKYVLHHHERWDGNGYPEGIKGNDIPLISQILTIADAWDAMVSKRSYRNALTKEEAIKEIKRNKGSQFSPEIVDHFLKIIEKTGGEISNEDISDNKLDKNKIKTEQFEKVLSFKEFFQESKEAIVLLNDNFNIIEINKYFKKMFGFKEAELTGYHIKKVVPKDKYPETDKLIKKLKAGKKINTNTYRKKRNGDTLDVSIQAFPLTSNNNLIIGYYLIYRDISERKKTKKQLKKEKEIFQNVLDSLSANIVILDNNGIIKYTNRAWRNFAKNNGIEAKKVGIGVNYLKVVEKSIKDNEINTKKVYQGIKDVTNGNKNKFELEYPCHSPNEKRWFKMKVSKLNTEVPFSVVISHDNITEWKEQK